MIYRLTEVIRFQSVCGEIIWRRRADSNRRIRVLQTPALTTWLRRPSYPRKLKIFAGTRLIWSGRRDSNSRLSPWQGDALPLSHFRLLTWCRGGDLNSYELTLTTPSRWRVYQFHHLGAVWQEWEDSNPRPAVLETAALPTELHSYPNY